MVKRERRLKGESSHETAFFIASLAAPARRLLDCTRCHWSIENCLHWVLDVAFHEDASRVRKDYAPQNLALMRHLALNLLKADKSTRASLHCKRLKAGWNDAYLLTLLAAI